MSTSYSPDTLIIDTADPSEVDRINDDLQHTGNGRPLGDPLPIGDGRLVVRVTLDPARARTLVDAVRPEGLASLEPSLENGTVKAASKDIGHGSSFALIDRTTEPQPTWRTVPPTMRRPVVALLDTGVQPHPWLPASSPSSGDPFLIDAEQEGWNPAPLLGNLILHDSDNSLQEGGHATFIAGLILAASPYTRILSLRVMTPQGTTRESVVNAALVWLLEYRRTHPVDVVCMAFGRKHGETGDSQDLARMHDLLKELAAAGVELVASAGNDHSDVPVYPAAFPEVTAVGAGFGGYHAAFSNYGDWVSRYRDGVGVFGIFPVPDEEGGWARWSGTSFAAANFAGDLARPHVV